jgi:hypothetical protein
MRTALILLVVGALGASVAHGATSEMTLNASYIASPVPDLGCQGFHITSAGSTDGSAGATSLVGAWADSECADVLVNPGSFTVRNGSFSVTTAEGVLLGTYGGTAGPPDLNLNVHVSGSFTIVGGTGAFADASGSGSFTADPNLVTGATTATFTGLLTLP